MSYPTSCEHCRRDRYEIHSSDQHGERLCVGCYQREPALARRVLLQLSDQHGWPGAHCA